VVGDFRAFLPELGRQVALDFEMADKQLDMLLVAGEVSPCVLSTDVNSGDFASVAERSDDHWIPLPAATCGNSIFDSVSSLARSTMRQAY